MPDFLREFSGAHLRAVFDPANFVQTGCDTRKDFKALSSYISYIHIKDAKKNRRIALRLGRYAPGRIFFTA